MQVNALVAGGNLLNVSDASFADPYQDYFEKEAEERKERIAKNEYKRLKNIARTEKGGRLKGDSSTVKRITAINCTPNYIEAMFSSNVQQ